jgi:hypothetical protein
MDRLALALVARFMRKRIPRPNPRLMTHAAMSVMSWSATETDDDLAIKGRFDLLAGTGLEISCSTAAILRYRALMR